MLITFKLNIMDSNFNFEKITSFEEACIYLNNKTSLSYDLLITSPLFEWTNDDDIRISVIAFYKLQVIFKAINNGWKPNWLKSDEIKYKPSFKLENEKLKPVFPGTMPTLCDIAALFCTDSREKVDFIYSYFLDEFKKLLGLNNENVPV